MSLKIVVCRIKGRTFFTPSSLSMRKKGLEPSRLSTQEPKSCTSANSVISANKPHKNLNLICLPIPSFPQNDLILTRLAAFSILQQNPPSAGLPIPSSLKQSPLSAGPAIPSSLQQSPLSAGPAIPPLLPGRRHILHYTFFPRILSSNSPLFRTVLFSCPSRSHCTELHSTSLLVP